MEVVVTSATIRRAKLHSYRHHHQTNTQLSASRMSFQQCHSTEVNIVVVDSVVQWLRRASLKVQTYHGRTFTGAREQFWQMPKCAEVTR